MIVPGTGIHLNNMLGEYDLVAGAPAEAGQRLTSMMAPSVVLGPTGPRLVVGSAGSVRLRGAIMQVDRERRRARAASSAEAIDAPRVHVEEPHVHCEGGFDDELSSTGSRRGATTSCGGAGATSTSAAPTRSRCSRTAVSTPPAMRAAAATASSSARERRFASVIAVERRHLAVAAGSLAHRLLEPHRFE